MIRFVAVIVISILASLFLEHTVDVGLLEHILTIFYIVAL